MDLVKHLNNIKEGRMAVHSSFSNALEHYLDIIKEVFEKASKPASDDDSEWLLKIKKAATHQTQKEEIARYRERLKYAWQRYNDSLIFDMHKKVTDVGVHVKEMQKNLARGRRTNRAPDNYGAGTPNYKNAHKDNIERCQDGTRTHELDVIRQWAAEPTSPQQIFWLNDAAGTGKTAIAATMDGEWQMSGYLASRFCFSASVNSEEPLKDLCFGLARGLVGCQPKIRDLVSDMLDDGSDDHYSYFDVCFKRLILEPLQDPRAPRPAVLVIDGLDHGTTKQQRKELLNALIRLLPSAKHVKVLLTSLPLQDIREHLVDSPLVCGSDMQLLDVHATSHPDITTYVDSQLSKYSKRGKITPEHRKMIVAKSDGLFLYAATVCRMLASDRLGRLQMLSASTAPPDIEKKMDELYMSVLDQVEIGRGEDQSIMDVLSTIVVAFQPISIDTISTFVPSIDEMEDIVGDLSGVLQISKSTHFVKIIHPTFRDFLLSNRERANSYFVDAASSHARMAIACLKTLDPVLGDDLFHVKEAGERPLRNQDITNVDELLDQRTTAAVRYASAYWAHHVAASEVSSALWKVILQFLDQKLLNWIELMSWRSCIPICIEGLARLYTKARMCHNKNPNVVDSRNLLIIRHAYQFAVYHQTLLTESALQVYSMALAFTPPNSPLFEVYRQQYKEHLPNITTSHVTEWGNQMMLKGHSGILRQILFSPTGPHLASLGEDGTLRIWNTETGGLAKEFSGEGEQDGSISDLIAHCDAGCNILACKPRAYTTATSPTSIYVARGDDLGPEGKGGIQLWDMASGKSLVIKGSHHNIIGLAFSPNGKLVAAASADSYVRLWKVSNQDMKGKPVHVPILSGRKVDTFFFSPDSRLLGICASGSAQVWDIKSGKLVWEHSDDTDRSSKIFAFSPDSKEIAGVDGSNLYISKLDSKPRALGPRKQSHYLTAAFSEEELLLAVAHDAGLQLWLINESWKLLHEVPLQPDSYHGLSFSSDGVDLAYGQLCWEVDSFPDVRYSGKAPPKSFIKDNKESNEKPRGHSFLTYKDGWIHSAFPRGPLLPIPSQLRDDSRWSAYGNSVILWNDFGEPIMIDCTSLLE
ncbi:hypothetical protein FRC17_001384 [Serendipita sp. 399]|nr:hypothetical protein FRC17_001384 [Serendipita sp. 399]